MTANLSQDQKDYFIEMAETSLNDLCTINHSTGSSQNSFAETTYTRTVISNVVCGISFASLTYKNEVNQAVLLTADAILRLKKDQSITTSDTVVCRGKTFTVDGVYEGLTLKIVALKAMELENG